MSVKVALCSPWARRLPRLAASKACTLLAVPAYYETKKGWHPVLRSSTPWPTN